MLDFLPPGVVWLPCCLAAVICRVVPVRHTLKRDGARRQPPRHHSHPR